MSNSRQTPPATQHQRHQSISVRKWVVAAYFLTLVSVVLTGTNSFPLTDRLIAGMLLGFVVSTLLTIFLVGWNRYAAKTRR
jgi:hypothetical protein